MPSNRQIQLEASGKTGVKIAEEMHRFLVRGVDTGGRLSISLIEATANKGPLSVCHMAEEVLVCVLDGSLSIGEGEGLAPGDSALFPRGCRLPVPSAGSARMLVAYAPGAVQEAFVSLADGSGGASQAEVADELAIWNVKLDAGEGELASPQQATIVRADQGERYWLAGDEYTIKIDGHATDGRFCVVHFRIPSGAGPLAHTHSLDEEIFHIVKGSASFWSEGGILEGSVGDTVVLPRGIPHAFRNRTAEETEFLAFFSPAGFDRFLRSAGRPATPGGKPPPPDDGERRRLMDAAIEYGLAVHADIEW